jgi:endo-1,4-beta-D-glucanase Y
MRTSFSVSALSAALVLRLCSACGGPDATGAAGPYGAVTSSGGSTTPRGAGGTGGSGASTLLGGRAGTNGSGGSADGGGRAGSGARATSILGGAAGTGGRAGSLAGGGADLGARGGSTTPGGAAGNGGSLALAGGGPLGGSTTLEGGAAGSGGSLSPGGSAGQSGSSARGGALAIGGSGGSDALGGAAGFSSYCSLPTQASLATARAAYETFKATVVTANGAGGDLRVWKPDSGTVIGSTVSEGMGYGMLLAVYHDDQAVFDELWRYVARYLNVRGLMDWEVDPQGNVIGTGAASDGDEDIAFALLMAARRWSGRGSLDEDYQVLGVRMVEAMWTYEVDRTRGYMWKPGDSWGDRDVTNLSYFAPAYFRVFGEVTGNIAGWNAVIDGNYAILDLTLNDTLGNADNGLVPAWSNSQGGLVSAYAGAPTHFQNDSTRTPFRIGQDWCWFGEPRAKAYLDKIASFYAGVGVANITDGYHLNGTPRPERPGAGVQAASFVGPAGVAFMSDPQYGAQLNEAWALVATERLTNGSIYYQKSWTALSLLMMSGNMLVYRAGAPNG